MPLQCAMVGGEGDDQLWGSGHGAIAGCHCRVPLQGAIVVCYGWGEAFFSTLATQKLFFAIWGLCGSNFFGVTCKQKLAKTDIFADCHQSDAIDLA